MPNLCSATDIHRLNPMPAFTLTSGDQSSIFRDCVQVFCFSVIHQAYSIFEFSERKSYWIHELSAAPQLCAVRKQHAANLHAGKTQPPSM